MTESLIQRILLVEDDEAFAGMVTLQLQTAGYHVVWVADAARALEKNQQETFDLILSDILMPGMSGLDMLEALSRSGSQVPVVVMSAYGSVDTAIEALKKGAYDYVSKPFKRDELVLSLRKIEERERLKRTIVGLRARLEEETRFGEIIGSSSGMKVVFSLLAKVAAFKTTVLIAGESGTGKELVARAIHRESPRKSKPFVAINCGAIPENLLESELFGHVRGAFTDAHADRKGLFEEADQGTLFLDEIGELPLSLQVKLLRTLQEGEVRRIGATRPTTVDVRVIAATARTLSEEVKAGRFREDLFYRLNVVQLHVPPLRDRLEDIEPLVQHFIDKTNARLGTHVSGLDSEALRAFQAYSWPGNVRELENAVERAAVLADGDTLTLESLPATLRDPKGRRSPVLEESDLSIKKAVAHLEEQYIRAALLKTAGNRTRAARLLEISHRALLYKIRDYNIDIPSRTGD